MTSTAEVGVPSGLEPIEVRLNYLFDFSQFGPGEFVILRQFKRWLKPILGFALAGHDVDVHAGFFAGEEIEPVAALSKYGRTDGVD